MKSAIGFLRLRQWPGYRRCVALIDKVDIRKAEQRVLVVPPDVAERLEAGYQTVLQRIAAINV